jgi:hypothetical protein
MSRHRAVRNLDLDEELAEDYYSDEDPYGMSPVRFHALNSCTHLQMGARYTFAPSMAFREPVSRRS